MPQRHGRVAASRADAATTYARHRPEETVLFAALQQHWSTFVADLEASAEPPTLPAFVVAEVEAFLRCGILAHGFVLAKCGDCGWSRPVAFSCKRRGFCPICIGRRMADFAAHLVDRVVPSVPVRQWVLTVPHPLRARMMFDPALTSVVLRELIRGVSSWLRRQARRLGVTGEVKTGAVAVIQRFNSAAAASPHFHTLFLDGVFTFAPGAGPLFHPTPAPRDEDVARVVAAVYRRVEPRIAVREPSVAQRRFEEDASAWCALAAASAAGVSATGPRRGRYVVRLRDGGVAVDAVVIGRLCADVAGFNLQAATRVAARDRDGLERLARYLARPSIANDRLTRFDDGRLQLELKRPWRDGTTAFVFTPHELIERLVALVPRPRAHLTRYFGVFAPAFSARAGIVPGVGAGGVPNDGESREDGQTRSRLRHVVRWRDRSSRRIVSVHGRNDRFFATTGPRERRVSWDRHVKRQGEAGYRPETSRTVDKRSATGNCRLAVGGRYGVCVRAPCITRQLSFTNTRAILAVMPLRIALILMLSLTSVSFNACTSNMGLGHEGDGAAGTGGVARLGTVDAGVPNIVPTLGCGRDPGQAAGTLVRGMIQTMGVKAPDCADTQCGAWSSLRYYWMSLPSNYDNTKAYPLVLEGPGCGAQGNSLYISPDLSDATIRVGLSPSDYAQAFHPVNPGLGCFDDMEGDDSVDWVFYENLYDKLAAEVCFDRNRVFAAGSRNGARMANELGCKYAGDALRPIRGVMTHGPALPVDAKDRPTCTTKPMAGIWIDQINNPEFSFAETTLAVTRAMGVNGCTIGTSYETAEFEPFPISSTDGSSCKMVKGCPPLFPLVICPLPIYITSTNDQSVVVPGWTAFVKLFAP